MDTLGSIFGNILKKTNPFSEQQGTSLLTSIDDLSVKIDDIQTGTAVLVSGVSQLNKASLETNRNIKYLTKSLRSFRSDMNMFNRGTQMFQTRQVGIFRENRLRDIQFQKDSRKYFRESESFLYKISNKNFGGSGKNEGGGLLDRLGGGLKKIGTTVAVGLVADALGESFIGIKPSDLLVGSETLFRKGGVLTKVGDTLADGFNRTKTWIESLNNESGFVKNIKDAFSEQGIVGRFGSTVKDGFDSVKGWVGGIASDSSIVKGIQSAFEDGGFFSKIGDSVSSGFNTVKNWGQSISADSGILKSVKDSFADGGFFSKIGDVAGTVREKFGSMRDLFKEGTALGTAGKFVGKILKPLDAVYAVVDGIEGVEKEGDRLGNTLAATKYTSAGFLGGFLDLGKLLNPINAYKKFINGEENVYGGGKEDILKFVDKSETWLADRLEDIFGMPNKIVEGAKDKIEKPKIPKLEPPKKPDQTATVEEPKANQKAPEIPSLENRAGEAIAKDIKAENNKAETTVKPPESKTITPSPQSNLLAAPEPPKQTANAESVSQPSLLPSNTTDSVVAGLTPGEVVVPKATAEANAPTLNAMMKGEDIPLFAEGGVVPAPGTVPTATPQPNLAGNRVGTIDELSLDSSKIKDVSFEKAKIDNINLGGNPNEVGGFWNTLAKNTGMQEGGATRTAIGKGVDYATGKAESFANAVNSKAQELLSNQTGDQMAFSKAINDTVNKLTGGIVSLQDETRVDFTSPYANKNARGFGAINASQRYSKEDIGTGPEQHNPLNVAPTSIGEKAGPSSAPMHGTAKDLAEVQANMDRLQTATPSATPSAQQNQAPNIQPTGATPEAQKVASAKTGGGRTDTMKSVYNAFANAGFSENQAKALTAEVGRENDYNPKYVYGSHTDAANGAKNIGFFSWQKERADALQKELEGKGLWKDGKMVQNQESLNTMAKFAKGEMESGKYKGIGNFLENKNVDSETAAKQLGKGYIQWAYGQDVLKSGKEFDWKAHDRKRANAYNEIDKIVKNEKTNPQKEPAKEQTAVQQATPKAQPELTPKTDKEPTPLQAPQEKPSGGYKPYVVGNMTQMMSKSNSLNQDELNNWQTTTNAGVALGKTLSDMRASNDKNVQAIAEKIQLTSANKGDHTKNSLHYKGNAFDFNRMNLTPKEQEIFSEFSKKNNLVKDAKVGGKIEPWHYSYRGEDQFKKQTAETEKAKVEQPDITKQTAEPTADDIGKQVNDLVNMGMDAYGKQNINLTPGFEQPKIAAQPKAAAVPSVGSQASQAIMNAGIKQEASRFPDQNAHVRAAATKPDLSIMGSGSSDGMGPVTGGSSGYDLNPYSNMSEFMRMSMLRGVSVIPGAPVGY